MNSIMHFIKDSQAVPVSRDHLTTRLDLHNIKHQYSFRSAMQISVNQKKKKKEKKSCTNFIIGIQNWQSKRDDADKQAESLLMDVAVIYFPYNATRNV